MASSFERFNLPPNIVTVLVAHSNASLAEATWANYGGLTRLVRRIEQFFDRQLPFPFNDTSTLLFCCYFLMKGYKLETIESHLPSLRMAHLTRGIDPPNIRPTVVQQLLRGNKNLKSLEDSWLGWASVDIEDLTVMRYNLSLIHI